MRNHRSLIRIILTLIATLPGVSIADATNDPLAKYENMITEALNQPVTQGNLQRGNSDSASRNIVNGQAALVPAAPPTAAVPAPAQQIIMPTQPYSADSGNTNTNTNTTNNTANAQPAGPPNIFITPGGNTNNNKQGNSIIHY